MTPPCGSASCGLMDIRGTEEMRNRASLSLSCGRLGLRNATRGRDCAFWASWPMHCPQFGSAIQQSLTKSVLHCREGTKVSILWKPHIAENVFRPADSKIQSGKMSPRDCNQAKFPWATPCQEWLDRVGKRAPRNTWKNGSAPTSCGLDSKHQGRRCCALRAGLWQAFLSVVSQSPRRPVSNRRSSAFFCFGVSVHNKLPVWRPLDPCGHHRATCQVAGVLGRRGFPIENAVARVCRKAGGRVTTNVRVQDMDIPPGAAVDNRRLEVVVDGLPLFHGAQLAMDATMVSPHWRDGTARRQCAITDGAALTQARRRKERTYPELAQVHGRARLVVMACEVGGRWSGEALSFVHSLLKAKARSEPEEFREVVERAWVRRWSSLLACAAARAFALSLLETRCTPGFDGSGPTSSEVYRDHRCEV